MDSSCEAPLSNDETELLQPYLTGLLKFYDDAQVQQIYQSTDNWDIVKNFTELVMFGKALNFILTVQPDLLKDVDRVFKLSGRYQLTDQFDRNLAVFSDPANRDRYIFAARRPSQFSSQLTNGLALQLMSRLWSWPVAATGLVSCRFQVMLEDFVGSLNQKQYRDIEHLLLRYFDGPKLLELPQIGVTGQLGPNGVTVQD